MTPTELLQKLQLRKTFTIPSTLANFRTIDQLTNEKKIIAEAVNGAWRCELASRETPKMKTYQLFANSKPKLKALSELKRVKRFSQVKFRAIALVTGEFAEEELEGIQIHETYEGDSFDALFPWIATNVLEELFNQEANRKPATERYKKQALADWVNAQTAISDAEKLLETAQEGLKTASLRLVSAMGKAPISFNGEIYDPSYTRETVRYQRRGS